MARIAFQNDVDYRHDCPKLWAVGGRGTHAHVPLSLDRIVREDEAEHGSEAVSNDEEPYNAHKHQKLAIDREDAAVEEENGGLGQRNARIVQDVGGERNPEVRVKLIGRIYIDVVSCTAEG